MTSVSRAQAGLTRRTLLKTLAAAPVVAALPTRPAWARTRRVLLVASNPVMHPVAGFPLGVWGEELAHSWLAFEGAGIGVDLASPTGGEVQLDPYSDPRNPHGGATGDSVTLQFLDRHDLTDRMKTTLPVGTLSADDHDGVLLLGGLGPVLTFRDNPDLQRLFLEFHDRGKVAATLCHGSALLLDLRKPDGTPFIAGRRITGFTTAEEEIIDQNIGIPNFNPYRIDEEARALGADFLSGPAYEPFAVADGSLVSGQQQQSTALVAQRVIDMLGRMS